MATFTHPISCCSKLTQYPVSLDPGAHNSEEIPSHQFISSYACLTPILDPAPEPKSNATSFHSRYCDFFLVIIQIFDLRGNALRLYPTLNMHPSPPSHNIPRLRCYALRPSNSGDNRLYEKVKDRIPDMELLTRVSSIPYACAEHTDQFNYTLRYQVEHYTWKQPRHHPGAYRFPLVKLYSRIAAPVPHAATDIPQPFPAAFAIHGVPPPQLRNPNGPPGHRVNPGVSLVPWNRQPPVDEVSIRGPMLVDGRMYREVLYFRCYRAPHAGSWQPWCKFRVNPSTGFIWAGCDDHDHTAVEWKESGPTMDVDRVRRQNQYHKRW